jgi:ATP:ADP antiporter, AAA family
MTDNARDRTTTAATSNESSWWSKIEPRERAAVFWATGWFYCILLGYLIIRPVRETMGSIGGTKQLQYMMLATFVTMLAAVPLYSTLVAKLPRRWLVRVVYHFFAASLVAFCLVMQFESEPIRVWSARIFFVWVNVFAFFATSVFWSVLADLFSSSQGKRLFGFIAAGGTAGAITGSIVTGQLAAILSTSSLLLLPALILEIGLCFAWRLEKASTSVGRDDTQTPPPTEMATGGGILSGITQVMRSPYLAMICVFLLFAQACATQLYFQQAEIVAAEIETKEARTQIFAHLDLGAQVLTLLLQVLLSGVILRRLGVGVALAALPIVYFIGFASLASNPVLVTLIVTMIATRAVGYGIAVPAREVLFTVVSREEKYKSKSFIDTVVLRGGDAASGQLFGWLRALEVSVTTMNWFAVPITAVWAVVAWNLGRRQQQLSKPTNEPLADT